MKKILSLALLCCLISHIAFPQEYFKKGSNILTGGLNVSVLNFDDRDNYQNQTDKNRTSGLSVNYGRFIKDNLVLGIGLGYSNLEQNFNIAYFDTTRTSYGNITNSNTISTNVFIRKCFPINEKFGAYFSSTLVYDKSKLKRNYDNSNSEYQIDNNSIGLSSGLGIYYFILDKVSLSLNFVDIGFRQSFGNGKFNDDDNNSTKKTTGVHISLFNQISFDQFFTINYHF